MNPSLYIARVWFRVLSVVAVNLLLVCVSTVRAQEKGPKYEVGLHYSALHAGKGE